MDALVDSGQMSWEGHFDISLGQPAACLAGAAFDELHNERKGVVGRK